MGYKQAFLGLRLLLLSKITELNSEVLDIENK